MSAWGSFQFVDISTVKVGDDLLNGFVVTYIEPLHYDTGDLAGYRWTEVRDGQAETHLSKPGTSLKVWQP